MNSVAFPGLRTWPVLLLLSLLGLLVTACSHPTAVPAEAGPALVWPSPPSESRIRWVAGIGSPGDLGLKVPLLAKVGNFLTGSDRHRERLRQPCGVAVEGEDLLCISDTQAACVTLYDLRRLRSTRWTRAGGLPFGSPVAVVLNAGVIYIADSSRMEVLALNQAGELLWRIREDGARPSGLAISQGRLCVAYANTHHISLYSLSGQPLLHFGRRGIQPGEFNFPTHLASDAQGRIYVTDAMNSRVQVFDPQGSFLRIIGGAGDGSGRFSRPKGIAIDPQGHVYVGDALFDNVQIFDEQGRFLLNFGSAGPGRGEFWMPAGLAIDPRGRIYVADSYNSRIQKFEYIHAP